MGMDMRTGPHKVLAATLTLYQPGRGEGGDYAQHILMFLPSFESLRHGKQLF